MVQKQSMGERYRRGHTAEFDDSDWEKATVVSEGGEEPAGILTEQTQLAVRVIHTYEGKYRYDAKERSFYL